MRFFLVRHTTTEWNLAGRLQGQTDIGLNSQGRVSAIQLASEFSNLGITFIVSSDLKRARETAEIIRSVLQIPLGLEQRLRECSFGSIEGFTKAEAIDKHGRLIADRWGDQRADYDFRPFGGECRNDVLARHMEVLDQLAACNQNDTILLVGHGRGMNTLLDELGHSPDLKQGEYRIIVYNKKAM